MNKDRKYCLLYTTKDHYSVFEKLNNAYQDDTLITFGNYIDSNTKKKKIN